MLSLFPPLEPVHKRVVKVDSIHHIYFEQSGNLSGLPVLFIHGGPGSGSNENHRRYFDPNLYHIINFDQRACYRSTPQGETRANTTADLLADIELIRNHLGLEQWLIFGGSWGATLALLYAQQYPARVLGMILRGVFLARKTDREWFFQEGANRLLPDAWDSFSSFIAPERQHNLVNAYYDCIHQGNEATAIAAATRWAIWTGTVVSWMLDTSGYNFVPDVSRMMNEVRIETHYARHDYFIEENSILNQISRIPQAPIMIIHGRRDLTCTLDSAWQLHHALPGSELVIVREGGHLASEAVMVNALVKATNSMAIKLKV